ncbi:uncharacterized protein QYS62_011276 [Fusarium acuminatum]|uniref:Uncharacterized protein n=1 Tax=Fusarium acuminatum TaxID=5515 RepID=A0ABZ2XAA3_9HYPO
MAGLVIVTVTATVFILEDETLDDFGSAVLVGTVDELDEGGFYGDAEIFSGSALALAFAWLIPQIDRLRIIEQQPYIPELDLYERRQWTPEDPCPTAIRAQIPGISQFRTFQVVHQAMKICGNIDVLKLRASRVSCVGFPEGYRMPFSLNGSDRYLSAPRVLSLEEYEFDYSEWAEIRPPTGIVEFSQWQEFGLAQQWYDQRYLPTGRQSMDDIQLWLEAMDFSQVHTLAIQGVSVIPRGKGLYEHFSRALTGLQSLTIRGEWKDWEAETKGISTLPTAKNFILGLQPSLESLEWKEGGTCGEDAFDAVLKYHGATLKHFEWTNSEIDFHPRPVPSLAQLRGLGEWAPWLESLAIDLHRDAGDWPQDELKTIAENLPDLKTLVLYLNARDEAPFQNHSYYTLNRTVLLEPRLDAEAALGMFRTLRQYKVGDTFDTVEFREGDWAESFGGGQISLRDDWMGSVRIWFKCRMVERDGVSEAECETGPSML